MGGVWPRFLFATFVRTVRHQAALASAIGLSAAASARADDGSERSFFADWAQTAARARATQPAWSSPLVTTTGMLEQRVRFDLAQQHAGNGTNTTQIDGGRGLDLIVSETNEVQFAPPAYVIRNGPGGRGALEGFADGAFLRVKQRLASAPKEQGDYILTIWLQLQAPLGIRALTNNAWTFLPTLAAGKGWGSFDVQATVGGVLPAEHGATLAIRS
jgi:hypothetical protein